MATKKENDAHSPAPKKEVNETLVIRKLSLVSVIGNAILSGFKLFAGIAGNSGAMISDAIHSFSDVLTTLIAWIGVKISKKASDSSHPYGHERLECIASLILGTVLLITGFGCCHCIHCGKRSHVLVHTLLRKADPFHRVFGGRVASPL